MTKTKNTLTSTPKSHIYLVAGIVFIVIVIVASLAVNQQKSTPAVSVTTSNDPYQNKAVALLTSLDKQQIFTSIDDTIAWSWAWHAYYARTQDAGALANLRQGLQEAARQSAQKQPSAKFNCLFLRDIINDTSLEPSLTATARDICVGATYQYAPDEELTSMRQTLQAGLDYEGDIIPVIYAPGYIYGSKQEALIAKFNHYGPGTFVQEKATFDRDQVAEATAIIQTAAITDLDKYAFLASVQDRQKEAEYRRGDLDYLDTYYLTDQIYELLISSDVNNMSLTTRCLAKQALASYIDIYASDVDISQREEMLSDLDTPATSAWCQLTRYLADPQDLDKDALMTTADQALNSEMYEKMIIAGLLSQ